jgi:hypothetical protein
MTDRTQETTHCLLAALNYAAKGWRVFPAPRGTKKSHKSAKYSDGSNWGATNDPEQIKRDFARWPEANVGIPTGAANAFWVLEADTKEGHSVDGIASLRALEDQYGKLPATLRAESPSGSVHLYFKWPAGIIIRNSASKVAPGIDVRGEGGMIIAPPSIKVGVGAYSWTSNVEPADAPDWLIELVVAAGNSSDNREHVSNPDLTAPLPLVEAAVNKIANPDLDWESWNNIGMAIFAASSGSNDGFALFDRFSRKSAKYDAAKTFDKWRSYHSSPPNRIGMGSLVHWANATAPGWLHEYDDQLAARINAAGDDDENLQLIMAEFHIYDNQALSANNDQTSDDIQETAAEYLNLEEGVTLTDFLAYMPMHNYIYIPTRDLWPGASVNARIRPIPILDANGDPECDDDGTEKSIKATTWLDQNQPVEQMTWAPGLPLLIRNRLVSTGGWIERQGVSCFNLYRPRAIKPGDATQATPWLDHVRKVYPVAADHIIAWLAHCVQHPEIKINHAIVLGGRPGIGKDTLLEPAKQAVGPWNFHEISPKQVLGRFNGFLKSTIMRISEARDLGDISRYEFYDAMKSYTAAPPDVLRIDEKNIREYYIINCVGVIITTNYKDALYLPPDDRRTYVAWSESAKEDFTEEYWKMLWNWYYAGGFGHVAAYLATLDISAFNPKAPPLKTQAFWTVVDINRSPEDSELADRIDSLGNPKALTLKMLMDVGRSSDLSNWLTDRRNRRAIPHRLERCEYVPVRNPNAKDGFWKIQDTRQVIYAQAALAPADQFRAATELMEDLNSSEPPM